MAPKVYGPYPLGSSQITLTRDTLPTAADMAFVPCDAVGSSGLLNRKILKSLDCKPDALSHLNLSKGYALLEESSRGVLAVVSIGKQGRSGVPLLGHNIAASLKKHGKLLEGRRVWLPLMGTGAGGLSPSVSLNATLEALAVGASDLGADFVLSAGPQLDEHEMAALGEGIVEYLGLISESRESGAESRTGKAESQPLDVKLDAVKSTRQSRKALGKGLAPKSKSKPKPKPKPKSKPKPKPKPAAPAERDQQRFLDDAAWGRDLLDRGAFADALCMYLCDSFAERLYDRAKSPSGEAGGEAFMLHLHAPWGAGKSFVLNLMHERLNKKAHQGKPWLVVPFNAWRNRHLDPPWWALMSALRRAGWRHVRKETYRGSLLPFVRFAWCEFWLRLRGSQFLIGIAGLLLLGVCLWYITSMKGGTAQSIIQTGNLAKSVTAILGGIVGVWTFYAQLRQSLWRDNRENLRAFLDVNADPMTALRKQYRKLLAALDCPVAILIDDLDRCPGSFVAGLLEGIQTLFRNPNVVFVVAADREWIDLSFEKAYEDYGNVASQPGQALGRKFSEKLFQIAARLPALTPEMRDKYLHELLVPGGKEEAPSVAQDFQSKNSEAEVLEEYKKHRAKGGPVARAAKQEAMKRLAQRDVQQEVQSHVLERFARYIDPNPRSVKRFVNTYTVLRLVTLSEEKTVGESQLARWIILTLRWPRLAAWFVERPARIEALLGGVKSGEHSKDEEIDRLCDSDEVKAVIQGADGEERLTVDTVVTCSGSYE